MKFGILALDIALYKSCVFYSGQIRTLTMKTWKRDLLYIYVAKKCWKAFFLYILPHALADILGRLAQRLLVSDRKS